MINTNYFNDTPIFKPEDDGFGIDGFAKALAHSFKELLQNPCRTKLID